MRTPDGDHDSSSAKAIGRVGLMLSAEAVGKVAAVLRGLVGQALGLSEAAASPRPP